MVLKWIWFLFFIGALATALIKVIIFHDVTVFKNIVDGMFDACQTSINLALYLAGIMVFWLGIMRIGEEGGAVGLLSRAVSPFFRRLFPGVPKGHPAMGSMLMNISANMLGLDNAATPMGIKAMHDLQDINDTPERASNAQIMFLVLNTSGLTLIPISVMALRAASGAANPTDIFLPILMATYCSTLAGLIAVSIRQRINLFQPVILLWLGAITAAVAGIFWYFSGLEKEAVEWQSTLAANFLIFGIIVAFLVMAMRRKVNVYSSFIDGAKDGFKVAVDIIPYLVAMLVGIAAFRASGAMDIILHLLEKSVAFLGIDTQFIPAMPTAFLKPLSGSGARGMMLEAMHHYGADAFAAKLACTFQGSTETTFYTLAVYFGAVKVRQTRYTVVCGLIADVAGIIAAIFIAYYFFA